ncbi:TrbM/KikA/MpfK family conjugal transfer protein [Gammaproteobacteria bacterium]|nr:TrbM/KikA/MpfK family conjugal transfer protein [Gammaproteobacteria bacterium]
MRVIFAFVILCSSAFAEEPVYSYLSGDEKFACEALVCLSDPIGEDTDECLPSLDKYFGIVKKKRFGGIDHGATEKLRSAFLALCPVIE